MTDRATKVSPPTGGQWQLLTTTNATTGGTHAHKGNTCELHYQNRQDAGRVRNGQTHGAACRSQSADAAWCIQDKTRTQGPRHRHPHHYGGRASHSGQSTARRTMPALVAAQRLRLDGLQHSHGRCARTARLAYSQSQCRHIRPLRPGQRKQALSGTSSNLPQYGFSSRMSKLAGRARLDVESQVLLKCLGLSKSQSNAHSALVGNVESKSNAFAHRANRRCVAQMRVLPNSRQHLSPLPCYGFSSYLRILGGRLGQFRPNCLPVVRSKITAGDYSLRRAFDRTCTFSRNASISGGHLRQKRWRYPKSGRQPSRVTLILLDVGFEVHITLAFAKVYVAIAKVATAKVNL